MSIVVLIRPGASAFEEQQRIEGALSVPLSADWSTRADELIAALRQAPIEKVLTGPAAASSSIAEAIGEAMEAPVVVVDELGNLNLGLWQGLSEGEVRRKYPKLVKQLEDKPTSVCPAGGETAAEFAERVKEALHRPLKRLEVFAIVMPEPGATLVKQLLLGEPLQVDCLCTSAEQSDEPEFINIDAKSVVGSWEAAVLAMPAGRPGT